MKVFNPEQAPENRVAEMSVKEYAERKGVTIPQVNFVGYPCLHMGEAPAKEIIEKLEVDKPDLVLFEDYLNHYGKDRGIKTLKKTRFASDEGFSYAILKYLADHDIPYTSFDRKFNSIDEADSFYSRQEAGNSISKVLEESILIRDDEHAWESFLLGRSMAYSRDERMNENREVAMLSNVAPEVLSFCKNKNVSKVKVAIVVGAFHKTGLLDKMKSRGDEVVISPTSFIEDDYPIKDILSLPGCVLSDILVSSSLDVIPDIKFAEITRFGHIVTTEQVKKIFTLYKHGKLRNEDVISLPGVKEWVR